MEANPVPRRFVEMDHAIPLKHRLPLSREFGMSNAIPECRTDRYDNFLATAQRPINPKFLIHVSTLLPLRRILRHVLWLSAQYCELARKHFNDVLAFFAIVKMPSFSVSDL